MRHAKTMNSDKTARPKHDFGPEVVPSGPSALLSPFSNPALNSSQLPIAEGV